MDALRLRIASTILSDAQSPSSDLEPCGPGVTELIIWLASFDPTTPLLSRADDLLRLAHQKLHTYPFSDVPVYWRRLFTDASLLKALGQLDSTASTDDVVKTLDMALIMAGAPGRNRRELIEDLIVTLPTSSGDSEPRGKRQKLTASPTPTTTPMHFDSTVDTVAISRPVCTAAAPSLSTFQQHIDSLNTPLHIVGDTLGHWPALSRWRSPGYLLSRTANGARLVPVELGRSYTDADWTQRILPFRDFLAAYMLPGRSDAAATGYLAQHDLFKQIPSLRADIAVPDYCLADVPAAPHVPAAQVVQLQEPQLHAWFGPRGTVSPLHTDPYANVLAQAVGSKYVRLYAPSQTARVYPRGVEAGGVDMSNTSLVDVEAEGDDAAERWPQFKGAEYTECILRAGECLYIPAGWWHYIRSLEVSCSVSFWWN